MCAEESADYFGLSNRAICQCYSAAQFNASSKIPDDDCDL